MQVARWIPPLVLTGVLLCFVVVVLGAYVRLTAAGLGCPDWPGCYGHLTPSFEADQSAAAQVASSQRPPDVGKAWREMIHRYAVSALVSIILVISATALATRRHHLVSIPLALALLAVVLFQALLGMLTVTWRLNPLIVTSHLLFGLTTLSLLWWLWLTLPRDSWANRTQRSAPRWTGRTDDAASLAHGLAVAGLIALGLQIALGGWTSSNYAAISCPDFPTCQNAWWPQTDYRDAFVLWRGLGVSYEGGVLTNTARVAIHLTHRIGALVTTLALCLAALAVLAQPALAKSRVAASAVLAALALQLSIGISMVLKGFPLLLATAHTAGAALLLLSVLALVRSVRA